MGHSEGFGLLVLDHFAFAEPLDGVRNVGEDVELEALHTQFEDSREDKIARKDSVATAPFGVDARFAVAHRGFVDDVVVNERGCVDEFDERRSQVHTTAEGCATIVEPCEEHHECGPYSLATIVEDVLEYVVKVGALGVECLVHKLFVFFEFVGQWCLDFGEGYV